LIKYNSEITYSFLQEAIARLTIAEDDAKRMSGDKSFILLAHFSMLNDDLSAAEDYLNNVKECE
jgi:hypothetical protein